LFLGGRRCWLAAVLRGLRLLRGGLLVGVGLLGGCLLGGCFLDGLLLLGLGGGGLLGPILRVRLGLFLRGRRASASADSSNRLSALSTISFTADSSASPLASVVTSSSVSGPSTATWFVPNRDRA
jgi:hypothetical protein